MKKRFLALVCGAVLWLLPASNVQAIPLFFAKFEARYAGAAAAPAFVDLVKKTKCNVCHVKGEKREVRNAYGEDLHILGLEKARFTRARANAEPDKVDKEIMDLFEKISTETSENGKTYGEMLKAGKLPVE